MASKPEVMTQDIESAIKRYRVSVSRFGRRVHGLDSTDFLPEALYLAESYEKRVQHARNETERLVYALKGPEYGKFVEIYRRLSERAGKYNKKLEKVKERQNAIARLEMAKNIQLPRIGSLFIEDDDILERRLPKESIQTARAEKTDGLTKWNDAIFSRLKEYASAALEKRDAKSYFITLNLVDLLNFLYEDYLRDALKKVILPYGRESLELATKIQNAVEKAKTPTTKMKRILRLLPEKLSSEQLLGLIASSSKNPP